MDILVTLSFNSFSGFLVAFVVYSTPDYLTKLKLCFHKWVKGEQTVDSILYM